MNTLIQKRCHPIAEGSPALSLQAAQALLAQTHGWVIDPTTTFISRTFHCGNYYETLALVNAIAWVAHQEDHHPELVVGYDKCTVSFNTHTVKGLSQNDFICAAKVNLLWSK